MQVLLTEEEYLALKEQAKPKQQLITREQLQTLCSKFATLKFRGLGITCTNGKPTGYVITYCDDCPCKQECPSENKRFSK